MRVFQCLRISLVFMCCLFCLGCINSMSASKVSDSSQLQQTEVDESVVEQALRNISYPPRAGFDKRPDIIEPQQLFELSEEQVQDFLAYLELPANKNVPDHKRVFQYLDQVTYRFSYRGKTLIAAKALENEAGNCLSLAILTTALASLADVKIAYQLVDSSPVFEMGENAVAKGVHIRSKLISSDANKARNSILSSFSRSWVVVDYFPGETERFLGNVSDGEFIARYYRNLAVDYLQQKDYSNSYWYTLKSFEYAPTSAEGINLMAVIYKQSGDLEKAEEIYQHGINVANQKLTLLKNYRQLLLAQKRTKEAEDIDDRIAQYVDPSPFSWLSLADHALHDGRHVEAQKLYNKAIDLAPYLQFGYLGLAKSYFSQGRMNDTEKMLVAAMERNFSIRNDKLYQAKLSALSRIKDANVEP